MQIHTSSRRGKKHAHFLLFALTNVLILGRLLRLLLCFVPCAKPHRLGAVRTTTTCHHILYRCRWSCGQNSWHGGWSFPQPFPSWIKRLKEGSCLGTVVDQAIIEGSRCCCGCLFWQTKIGETQTGSLFLKIQIAHDLVTMVTSHLQYMPRNSRQVAPPARWWHMEVSYLLLWNFELWTDKGTFFRLDRKIPPRGEQIHSTL